jgi:hypothetical protein
VKHVFLPHAYGIPKCHSVPSFSIVEFGIHESVKLFAKGWVAGVWYPKGTGIFFCTPTIETPSTSYRYEDLQFQIKYARSLNPLNHHFLMPRFRMCGASLWDPPPPSPCSLVIKYTENSYFAIYVCDFWLHIDACCWMNNMCAANKEKSHRKVPLPYASNCLPQYFLSIQCTNTQFGKMFLYLRGTQSVRTPSRAHEAYSIGDEGCFSRGDRSGQAMKLTTLLRLVSRLRTSLLCRMPRGHVQRNIALQVSS